MTDELTKALLLEEVTSEDAIAEALLASVTGGRPFVQALSESRAINARAPRRATSRAPRRLILRHVVPLPELVDRLPPGLCARLLALPVRRDAITGTVDVVVADAGDLHPAKEIAFHLGAPVRLVRGAARSHRGGAPAPPGTLRPPPPHDVRDDDRIYDSRPRNVPLASDRAASPFKGGTLPPVDPAHRITSSQAMLDALSAEALRPSRLPVAERQAYVLPSAPQRAAARP